MKLRFNPRLAVASVASLFVAAGPGALAAAHDTLKVSAPHSAKAGAQIKFTATATTIAAKRVFTEFVSTGAKCHKTYRSELSSSFGMTVKTTVLKKKGTYTIHGRITNSFTGTHYLCLYLIKSKRSGKTLARASAKYNVS